MEPLYLIAFALKLQKVRTTCILYDFLSEDRGDCQNGMYVEVGNKCVEKYDFLEFTSR